MKRHGQKYLFSDTKKVSLKITVTDSSALHRCWYFNNQKRVQQNLGIIHFLQCRVKILTLKINRRLLTVKVMKAACCTKCQLQPVVSKHGWL